MEDTVVGSRRAIRTSSVSNAGLKSLTLRMVVNGTTLWRTICTLSPANFNELLNLFNCNQSEGEWARLNRLIGG